MLIFDPESLDAGTRRLERIFSGARERIVIHYHQWSVCLKVAAVRQVGF